MKKFFKKLKKTAQEWFCWIFCPEVLDAINDGCAYEEVEEVVRLCVQRNFGGRRCQREDT